MRRIYESEALSRDDEDQFTPYEQAREYEPQSFRSVNTAALSDRLLPHSLRCRAISIRISTPRAEFERGDDVPFEVTMKNSLPVPITIRTASPLVWTWTVDGIQEASHVDLRNPPERTGELYFDRGERKRFRKRWSGMFRVAGKEWDVAEPGEYVLGAEINVDGSNTGLSDETTVRIVR